MAAVTGATSVSDLKHLEGGGFRARVQRFGGTPAGMIMLNIGAFIAWGLITALFIPTGWLPNEDLAALVGPMILTLLPILIGYTGGRLVHGQRGAVVGAVATMGVVVGSDVPMFLGAMIIGPARRPTCSSCSTASSRTGSSAGFEMLVDNFIAGILGAGHGRVRRLGHRPGGRRRHRVGRQRRRLARRQQPAAAGLDPHRAGQGAVPQQRHQPRRARPAGRAPRPAEQGKSILFMLETNPGPGLGILLASCSSAPRAAPERPRPRSSSSSSAASTRSTSRTC